jgi:HEAT repeat protein
MTPSRSLTQLVGDLAVEHRAKPAKRTLIAAGSDAVPALRAGLCHADMRVVIACIDAIDRVLDEAALEALLGVIDHPNPLVRARALHALSCERCKQGECRPNEAELRTALIAACDDPDPYVRYIAVEGLSVMIHDWDQALAAVVRLAQSDPAPFVRKKAALAAPGGPIYEGRRSKTGRLRRRPPGR